jgi:stage V sporulation protein K
MKVVTGVEISLKFSHGQPISGMKPDTSLPSSANARWPSLQELDKLVGLREIKKVVWEFAAFALIQKKRAEQNLKAQPVVMHMIMKGNPGTGKTTVARILGQVFRELGILPRGHLVEVERADLVGEYIGHTAQKTRAQLSEAEGGILFVDEAYTLAQGGAKDFGRESIATLVKAMEDSRERLVVVLAGYREEMDFFLQSNPGLRSRFPIQIEFPDYTSDELFDIAVHMFSEREYTLSSRARWKLRHLLSQFYRERGSHSGNARYARNLVEKAIRLQAMRLVNRQSLNKQELLTIDDKDLPDVCNIY